MHAVLPELHELHVLRPQPEAAPRSRARNILPLRSLQCARMLLG